MSYNSIIISNNINYIYVFVCVPGNYNSTVKQPIKNTWLYIVCFKQYTV